MTLNGVMAQFGSFRGQLRKSGWRYTDTFSARNVALRIYVLAIYHLWRYLQEITPSEVLKARRLVASENLTNRIKADGLSIGTIIGDLE